MKPFYTLVQMQISDGIEYPVTKKKVSSLKILREITKKMLKDEYHC